MSNLFPSADVSGGVLSVSFSGSPVTSSVGVVCMLDMSDFGDVIGVEVMDWQRQLSGGFLDACSSSGAVHWSYDDEIDAMYIHVTDGRGQVQRRANGQVGLDAEHRVVRLDLPVPSVVA